MTERPRFMQEDLDHQRILDGEYWTVILPQRPVSPFHLMAVVKDADKQLFTDLTDPELVGLRATLHQIIGSVATRYSTYDGYNLFSNNGSARIGQHMLHFHQHMFLRFTDETESPYAVMGRGDKWSGVETEEWTDQRDRLRQIIEGGAGE